MTLKNSPVAKATMLIRRPIEEVFNSFIDPTVTTKFWFSRSTGPLKLGETVTWYWDHYGVSGDVFVKAIEENKRIEIESTLVFYKIILCICYLIVLFV